MISTDTNPQAVQAALDSIPQDVEEEAPQVDLPTRYPTDGEVQLVAGLLEPTGLIDTAVVRELNGRDEEAIAKTSTVAKSMLVVLYRGVESLGGKQATPEDLDMLLAADRDLLLTKIRQVTFGNEVELNLGCPNCGRENEVTLNIEEDIPVKRLEDPIHDRIFEVPLRNGVAVVRLPTGLTQKEISLAANGDKSAAELNTMLLYGCVKSINGRDVLDISQILDLGMQDRQSLIDALVDHTPGPQWGKVFKSCPSCEEEVQIPLTADRLFQL